MPLRTLLIHVRIPRHSLGEFPHSDICGSMLIYSSPQLFAVSHVLHRRQVPRHPPYALCSLIFFKSLSALKSHITSLVSLCILSKISYIVNCSYYSLLFILLDILIDRDSIPSCDMKPPMQLSMCFASDESRYLETSE